MRFRALQYRPVVSAEDAEQVGELVDVVFRSEGGGLAGIDVGVSLLAGFISRGSVLPTEHLVALGDDAVTITSKHDLRPFVSSGERHVHQISHAFGRTAVTRSGRLLGAIEDAELDVQHRVIDYLVCQAARLQPDELPGIRITNFLRIGRDVVVVPDDAVFSAQSFPFSFENLATLPGSGVHGSSAGDPLAAP